MDNMKLIIKCLEKILISIDETTNNISKYPVEENKVMLQMVELTEEFENLINLASNCLNIEEINSELKIIMNSIMNKNYVLLCDVLKYEMKPKLEEIKNNL